MYAFLKYVISQKLILEQLPVFTVSLVIAERCYKFHSFTWECLAFLSTWFVLDMIANAISRLLTK